MAGSLLNKKTIVYKQTIRKEYEDFRNKFLQRQVKKELITIKSARKNKLKLNWEEFEPTKPNNCGISITENQNLEDLIEYIDWSPFLDLGTYMVDIPKYWMMKLLVNKLKNYFRMLISCFKKF